MILNIAYASNHVSTAQGFLDKINEAILFPLITLMMAIALLIFLYGCFEYVRNSASDGAREQGRKHIIWGIIGMLVMISAYSILTIAAGTFDLEGELYQHDTNSVNRAPSSPLPTNSGQGGLNRVPNSGEGSLDAAAGSVPGGLNP